MIHRIDTITSWACGQEISQCYFPEPMQHLVQDKWPKIKIFNTFVDYPGAGQRAKFLHTFPVPNLISLTFYNRGFGNSVPALQRFLTRCVSLKELRFFDTNVSFFPELGRRPPGNISCTMQLPNASLTSLKIC